MVPGIAMFALLPIVGEHVTYLTYVTNVCDTGLTG